MSEFGCTEPRPGVLSLSGELSVATAARVNALLLSSLRKYDRLEVDLLNVSVFDTAGVQLLLVLQREASSSGKSLVWLGFSLAVAEVLELLRLSDVLGRPGAVVWS